MANQKLSFISFLVDLFSYPSIVDREIRVEPYHSLVEINSKAKLHNVEDVFVFANQW
jgi:hypothetical protein